MAASNSRVPYDHVCKKHPEATGRDWSKRQVQLYEWLDERCNAGSGDPPDHNYPDALEPEPDSLERLKRDFQDLLPTFAYFLRQKSGQQIPYATEGITSLTIPAGKTIPGQQSVLQRGFYKSFFDFIGEGRIKRIGLGTEDFMMIFGKQQRLYWLAVNLVFTGPHPHGNRPFSVPRKGHMILEPGKSEAALLKLLDITTNINEDQSMNERQKQDAWFTELGPWQMWQNTGENNGNGMLPAVRDLYSFYFDAFEDYYRDHHANYEGMSFLTYDPLHNMIPLIESFYQCFKAGAGRGGADLVEFVTRQMEEKILQPANDRLINALNLVSGYVEAKMQEIKLLQRLDYLRHQPERIGYGTNTEDMRLIIWQQGRLSPLDWQRAFEELGLFDTFQKLTRIFDRGPYSRI